MSDTMSGNNTLNVTGGNNQFVVVYQQAPADATAANPAGGGAAAFGAPGALNNTDPNFDFSSLNNGQVYVVTGGGNTTTIDGGNKQFVVDYIVPASSTGAGGNTVNVGGGNNLFVVAYQDATAGTGNSVSVAGGSNKFVVADNNASGGGGNSVSVAGGGNQFAVAGNDPSNIGGNAVSVDGGSNQFAVSYSGSASSGSGSGTPGQISGSNNQGMAVGSPGSNSVSVTGDNNQYAIDYASGSSSGGMAGSAGGGAPSAANPFAGAAGGANPFATATGGGANPFAAGMGGGANPFASAGGAPASDPSASAGSSGGAPSSDQLTSLLAASPFGPLLSLPGVTVQTIFGNLGGGANPFASMGSGASSGGAPSADQLGSLLASSPFGPLLSLPGVTTDTLFASFSGGPSASGAGGGAPSAAPPAGAPSSDQLTTLLAGSPFGAMLNSMGISADSFFSGLASGANPFAGAAPSGVPADGSAGLPSSPPAVDPAAGNLAGGQNPLVAIFANLQGNDPSLTMISAFDPASAAAISSIISGGTGAGSFDPAALAALGSSPVPVTSPGSDGLQVMPQTTA